MKHWEVCPSLCWKAFSWYVLVMYYKLTNDCCCIELFFLNPIFEKVYSVLCFYVCILFFNQDFSGMDFVHFNKHFTSFKVKYVFKMLQVECTVELLRENSLHILATPPLPLTMFSVKNLSRHWIQQSFSVF